MQANATARRALAWARAHPSAGLYAAAFLIRIAVAPFFIHDWDGYVFIQSVRDFLAGTTPYEAVEAEPSRIFVGDAYPVVNSWYAYPPLPLLLMLPGYWLLTLATHAPWAERLGVKLPMIAADLLLAWVAAALVREILRENAPAIAEKRAQFVERFLLFNPFLIFITAVWGMFDAWIFVFLLASFLLAIRGRVALAGVAFALAVLVKPFPILFAPLLVAFIVHRHGAQSAAKSVGAGALAGLAVCLPFLLSAPEGFIQQTIMNHASRPPQGFALVSLPIAFPWITGVTGIPLPANVTMEAISRASFVLLASLLLLIYARAHTVRDPATLLRLSVACVIVLLLVSKVVNEQYFVMPTILAIVAWAATGRALYRWGAFAITFGGFVSAFFLGWHFVTFVPPDVALRVFPVDPDEVVPRILGFLGWGGYESFVYPIVIGAVSLLPAAALGLAALVPELLAPFRALARRLHLRPALAVPASIALVVVLIVAPFSAGGFHSAAGDDPDPADPAPTQGPLVGTYYYLWWNNPAHDPAIEWGNWRKGVTQVPVDGYTTVSAGKMRNDFRAMRANGIDLVVYSYHEYDQPKIPALTGLARENGLLVAPLLELGEIYSRSEHKPRDENGNTIPHTLGYSMRDETRNALTGFIAGGLAGVTDAPAMWRIDGKPVVVLYDSYFTSFDASGEVRERMTDAALRIAAEDRAAGRPTFDVTRDELERSFPRSQGEIYEARPHAALWRRAYEDVYLAFWAKIRADLEDRFGPLFFLGGELWDETLPSNRGPTIAIGGFERFDASFVYSPSFTWVFNKTASLDDNYARWRTHNVVKAQHDRASDRPVVVSISPAYDDRVLRKEIGFAIDAGAGEDAFYARQWSDALSLAADVVLVATWNEFYEGTAIEPTDVYGTRFLDETRRFAEKFRDRAAPAGERVLLVTDLRGSSFVPGVADPDWTFALSVDLMRLGEETWGARAEAVDWNGPAISSVDLSRYVLVVVEPGAGIAHTPAASAFARALRDYVERGGRALVLGSAVGVDYATLVTWGEEAILGGATRIEGPTGTFPIDSTDRTRLHGIPPDALTYLWMENATERASAAWRVPLGEGMLAVTAFKPQGRGPITDLDREAFRLVVAPVLRSEGSA